MAVPSSVASQQSASLQKQAAIGKARSSFSRLPSGDANFQQCIDQADSIPDVVKSVIQTSRSYRGRQSTRLLRKFEQHTQFLQNTSDIVDIVVQTQAGIGCPLWAPIKFVLKVSKDPAMAAEQVLNLIEVISENHPRFEIHEKLSPDPILQVALLNMFIDVVEFSVRAIRFFTRSATARMAKLLVHPFKGEFGDIFDRFKRRTEVVDLTAMAIQLLPAAESRQEAQEFRCQSWLEAPNVTDFHQLQVHTKLPGTCDWTEGDPAFEKWYDPSESSSSHTSDALIQNPTLPQHRKIDVLLRLESHLRRVRVLTDPLKTLFRTILQKSHAIPAYALLAVGNCYYSLEKWGEALEVYRAALAKVEAHEMPLKFDILSRVGHALKHQEKYQEAEVAFRRCFEGRERVLGKENNHTFNSVYWLGAMLEKQKKHKEAEIIFREAIKMEERIWGKEHEKSFRSAHFLVSVLCAQGQYVEAETLCRQCLEGRERVLGKESKYTLRSVYWLAYVRCMQGQYVEAEALYRQTLEARERILGKEHKDTLWSAYWLAHVLGMQGQYVEAEALYLRTLEARERILGKENQDTLWSMYQLAYVLGKQRKYQEAEVMYRRSLEGRERILGKENKDTVDNVIWLAHMLRFQGKHREVESIYRQTLETREKTLGKEDKDTLWSAYYLAGTLHELGKYEAAEEMYRRTIEGGRAVPGKEHPATQASISQLAKMFHDKASSLSEMSGNATPLQEAAKGGHLEVVHCMLNQGADVNQAPERIGGRTALQAASEAGCSAIVQLLLKHHANVNDNPASYSGKTALQAAAGNGHLEVAQLLLEHGADVNANAALYGQSRTALQAASGNGHLEVVQLLLERGADVNAGGTIYSSWRTALQAASAGGHLEIVRLLLTHGTNDDT